MKYVFASAEWFAALHAIVCERARLATATHPGYRYAICEVFTGVPDALATLPGNRTCWQARIECAEVTFSRAESDNVDFKAVGDYASIVPLGQFDTRADPARMAQLQAMGLALVESGKLVMKGKSPGGDGPLGSIHDAIARLTA